MVGMNGLWTGVGGRMGNGWIYSGCGVDRWRVMLLLLLFVCSKSSRILFFSFDVCG